MASMTGTQPIEYYYPAGFGELKLAAQGDPFHSLTGDIRWLSPPVLNKYYNESSPSNPFFEQQRVVRPQDPDGGCRTTIRLRASYVSYVGTPATTGGSLKFAIINGVFPPSLTLDIDTGYIFGKIDDLDDIFPEEFGFDSSQGMPEDPKDIQAAETFGFDFGEQDPRKFTEDNYGVRGSSSLYKAGFAITKGIFFTARAFDSSLTGRYVDREFVINMSNNWSSDRDAFILNIRNQMFVDGQPVTNKQYLTTMKGRGYFPNC